MAKEPKHKHPKEMTNGDFNSSGGLEIYKLLWGLQGRVGRLEGGFAIGVVLLATIVGLLVKILVEME